MDSMPKIINHLLYVTLLFTSFLFLVSLGAPNVGLNVTLISLILAIQSVSVFFTLNHSSIPALHFLSPTPLMIGVALGTTIGAAILAFVVSSAYRYLSSCKLDGKDMHPRSFHGNSTIPTDDPVLEYLCQKGVGSSSAVCFWSGLVFWCDSCVCLLIMMGQNELLQGQYQHLASSNGPPSFVGDYSNIPEVRGNESGSFQSSHQAALVQNV
ncbi:hypothetical protein FisN_4Lu596 [Fistulifera solaris]|uniref:Uncharacterized protein n=1 Tax=Fistulifera solaris TaxID=1519565 RepID=A0A1Z5KDB0_FISSO|nr:hypothetical protein FisN_4Lu596 [Fistulifera solaris]|eukprot:GAX24290.1 hypothetical protein FisN_4Lu596 [Fistulifera solaris]